MRQQTNTPNAVLSLFDAVLKIPMVKVDRTQFLTETFQDKPLSSAQYQQLLEQGPLASGLISQAEVKKLAQKICTRRVLASSGASFAAGVPGGFTIAASIPADTIQFFAFSLRIAQEIAYLYGYKNFWKDASANAEAKLELMLFLATMLAVGGAANLSRIFATKLAEQTAKNLANTTLSKHAWYAIVQQLAKYLGYTISKDTVARSLSKVVPLIGGVVSGGMTYFTLSKMGNRLIDAFDKGVVYTQEERREDIIELQEVMPDVYAQIKDEL